MSGKVPGLLLFAVGLAAVFAGHYLVAVRVQRVPTVGGQCIAREGQAAKADQQGERGAGKKLLHADSTLGQLITHSGPSLIRRLHGAGRIMQKARGHSTQAQS